MTRTFFAVVVLEQATGETRQQEPSVFRDGCAERAVERVGASIQKMRRVPRRTADEGETEVEDKDVG